jgi:subtilisin family serine protease
VVAVLDTGVDMSHDFFNGRILPGVDLVDDDNDPSEVADGIDQDGDGQADEAHGHGTFVAGVVLQIAPNARILPVRVLDAEGNGDRYAVVAGIEYAVAQGADVINLSFGLNGELESKRLEEAVKWAHDQGVVVVAAAGNNSDDNKHFPAALKKVVSVTALDETNEDLARYANRGKWISVAAPGNDIVSTTAGGGYARWSGTSMATPVVAGGYAVVGEHLAGEKLKDIIEAIQKTALKMLRKDAVDKGILNLAEAVAN